MLPLKKGRLEDKKTHWQVFWLADIRTRDAFSPPHRKTEERGNGIMPGTAAAPAPESDTGAGGDQSAHSCGTVRDSHPVPF